MEPLPLSRATDGLDESDLRHALNHARLSLHNRSTWVSTAASLMAGTILLLLLGREGIVSPSLRGWWLALLAVLLLRLAVPWIQRRFPAAGSTQRWLIGHRLAFGLHGLVWASLVLWALPDLGFTALHLVAFVGAAMAAGSLITGAFDLLAAAAFVTPAALPLLMRLLSPPTPPHPPTDGLAVAVGMFLVIMALASRRAAALFKAQVRATLAERHRLQQAQASAADTEAARRALADQHALLRQMIQGTGQGYWFVDPAGATVEVNPAMCTLLGRPRDEVLGRGVFDFFHGPERAVLAHELALRRQGITSGYEVDIVRPDGSRVHALNHATPIYDTDGRLLGSIGLWTDLSTRKALEQGLRTYERVANSIADMVSVVGPDRCYRLVNDAWCRQAGVAREQALGRSAPEHPLQLDPAAPMALVEACFVDGTVATQTLTVPTQGGPLRLQTTCFPDRDGGSQVRSVILVTRDVTQQEEDRARTSAASEYLVRTLEATGDAIFASDASDPRQPVRLVNARMFSLLGLPADRAASLTPADIMAAALPLFEDPEFQARHVADVIDRNLADESEVRLKDGRVLNRRCQPASAGAHPLRVWTFRDVTEQHRMTEQLRHREAELRALFEAFPGYIGAVDEDLRYVFMNRKAAELVGHSAESLIGRPLSEVLGEERARLNRAEAERARAGEVVRVERLFPSPDGRRKLHIEITHLAGPRGPDGRQLFYSFGLDMTAHHEALAALARARDEAERANLAKSRFLSHMSHELRTPLNAIGGFAQLLERDRRTPLMPYQATWVGQILRGSQHLATLINELLDLGRIEAGQLALQFEAVRLPDLFDECLVFVGGLAGSRQVQLLPSAWPDGALLPSVWADRTRLKQVLLNLLSNAIKYNHSGGQVQLRCQLDGTQLLLQVHDTGPGLSPEQQARLFQPFERLGAERGNVEGTGIGLLLCRHLVEAMSGRIGLDSTVGRGSVFWLRLPAAAPGTAPMPLDGADTRLDGHAADAAAMTVLYVDDNPVNLMLVEAMLEGQPGLRVLGCPRPQDALMLARSQRPGVILLDIHMPGLNGYQVLARLQSEVALQGTPVVAVSADAAPAEIEAALAAGFAAYLTKPVDMQALIETVNRLRLT